MLLQDIITVTRKVGLALHLLQNALVYIHTLMIQQVLTDHTWCERMQPEDLRALTPLMYAVCAYYPLWAVRAGYAEAALSQGCLEPLESEAVPATLPLVTARIIRIKMAGIIHQAPGSWRGPCDSGGLDREAKGVPQDSRLSEDSTVSSSLDHASRAELL